MSYPRTVAEAGIKILRHHDQEYEIPVRHVQWGGIMKRYDEMGRAIFDDEIGIADECCTLAWPSENLQSRTSGFANAWPAVLGGGMGGSGKGGGKKQSQGGGGAGAEFSGVRTNFSNGSPNAGATFSGVKSNFSSGSAQAGGSFTGGTNPKLDPNSANYGFRPNGPANQGNGMNVHMDPQEPGAGGTGGQAPVATPGKAPKSHCGSMSGKHQMLPVLGDGWEADDRFKGLEVTLPPDYPKMPKGVYGIAIAGTHEYEQKSLFFPTETRLFAVNVAGDPRMGSMVYDLDDEFRVDKDRGAPLQSAFRVLKEPIGGANAIAIQLGQSGCTDTEGGYVYDVGQGGEPAGKGTQVEQELPYVIAQLSVNKGGFIDVGSSDDKHENGADADGTKINKAHISTKALFRRNRSEDGPIEFNGPYPQPIKLPKKVEAHLGWDDATQMWRFWSETPHEMISWVPTFPPPQLPQTPTGPKLSNMNVPMVPMPLPPTGMTASAGKANPATIKQPNPPVATPATVSTSTGTVQGAKPFTNPLESGTPAPPGAPFVPTGVIVPEEPFGPPQLISNEINPLPTPATIAGQSFLGSNMAFASSQELSQPVGWGAAAASYGKGATASPVTGGMSAFGAQGGQQAPTSCGGGPLYVGAGGDPWVYNQKPGSGRFAVGTASGGWIIHPPETSPADQESYGMVPPNTTLSTTYFMTAPGAYFAAGTPNLAIGGVTSGWSWGMDSTTGDLLWRSHVLGDATNGIRFILSSQNIAWYSGTTFQGIFDHANTANRTYTFPNVTAPVAMMLTGTGDPNGSVTAPESTLYWDTSGNTAYVNNNSGTAWTVLAAGGGTAPTAATYLTLSLDGALSAERVLTAGSGIAFADTGANGTLTISATGGGMGGTGTAYKIPKFTAATTLADSTLSTDAADETWTLAPVAATGGNPTLFTLTGPAHTNLSPTDIPDVLFDLDRTVQFSAAGPFSQRTIAIEAPTYSASGAQTIDTATTLWISGPPSAGANVTITQRFALYLAGGDMFVTGHVWAGYSPGSILFVGSGGELTEDTSNLVWDDTNNRLGLGTSPASTLHVKATADCYLTIDSSGANTLDRGLVFLNQTGADAGYLTIIPNTVGTDAVMNFYVGGGAAADLKFSIYDNGGVGVGLGLALPGRRFEVRDSSDPAIRLSYDGSNYTDLQTNSSGTFVFIPSGQSADFQGSSTFSLTLVSTGVGSANLGFTTNSTSRWTVYVPSASADLRFSDGTDRITFQNGGKAIFTAEVELDGALNHDGSTVGFYGVTPVVRSSAYTPSNVSTDRTYNANATSIDEIADVLGTLIADLQLTGIIG